MANPPYRIFGLSLSPYSLKVRAAFRFKGLPHEWIPRNSRSDAEFQERARLPLVPLAAILSDEAIVPPRLTISPALILPSPAPQFADVLNHAADARFPASDPDPSPLPAWEM